MALVIAGGERRLAELDLIMKEALVVFAKAPIAGQVKTRLIGALTSEEVAQLYICFLRDTFATMEVVQEERENLSLVLCFTPSDEIEAFESADLDGCLMMAQHGDELGTKLRNCLADLFELGFGKIVIIGADTPTLPEEIIIEAFEQLTSQNQVVIGPATDGGYYLIGMSQLQPKLFENINWSSENVLTETLARAGEASLTISQLPAWDDIDSPHDLEKLKLEIKAEPALANNTGKYLKALLKIDKLL